MGLGRRLSVSQSTVPLALVPACESAPVKQYVEPFAWRSMPFIQKGGRYVAVRETPDGAHLVGNN